MSRRGNLETLYNLFESYQWAIVPQNTETRLAVTICLLLHGFLTVRIGGNMKFYEIIYCETKNQGPRSNGCRMRGCDTQDRLTNGFLGNIYGYGPGFQVEKVAFYKPSESRIWRPNPRDNITL